MSENKHISIKGARVNNLKNIDVDIPQQACRDHRTIRFGEIVARF